MGDLAGRHALVTGGGSGIGAAIASALAADGATVTIAGRRGDVLKATAARIPRCHAVEANVTKEADCAAMFDAAIARNGPVDIVVANAGAAESAPAAKIDIAHWHRMIDVNLTGAFLTARAGLGSLLRPIDGGVALRRLVFVSSTAGLKGYPYVAAYCAAKHGVVGMMRALAAEFATRGITVNAVCPGFTETPLLAGAVANIVAKTGRGEDVAKSELARANPQGRLVTPEEVAQTVLWLCLPSAQSIHGQAISISGGEV
jgi:NAD(P)-dependent dehydrogenase (short-subunit alcohol dehydrogenase family)